MATLVKYSCVFYTFNVIFLVFISNAIAIDCPRMLQQIFEFSAPIGNNKAGNITEHKHGTTLNECAIDCCEAQNDCNVAFIYNQTCYHVKCASNELCLPLKRPNVTKELQMVLVNPVSEDDPSWVDILKKESHASGYAIDVPKTSYFDKYPLNDVYGVPYSEEMPSEKHFNNFYTNRDNIGFERFPNDQYLNDQDLMMDESKLYNTKYMSCEVGLDNLCPANEQCVPLQSKSRNGLCRCIQTFFRNDKGNCEKIKTILSDSLADKLIMQNINNYNAEIDDSVISDATKTKNEFESSESPIMKHLTVSVVSKSVRLPEKEVTLSVYTVPDEKSSGNKYSYIWTLISQPTGATNGTMTDQTKDEVKLSNLSEGLYRFKVSVNGNGFFGEAYANVTVSPEKRINKPPEVIITPKQQTVKLPNSEGILDGSTSKDDDSIISWHWELIQGPIGYQPTLSDTSTLQLTDLTSPGNYTFKLTVTDSDQAQNSTTANITVLKGIDYPPEANAGPDVIVYLPHNNVILNGSLSTDDREIVAWEWTKDSNEQSEAVDMQNTRTPFLQLSNLEKGIYTFVLKVTDGNNQTSSATVHVFVKPPTNLPPVANAGQNITINLPQTWVVLNGSMSTDDVAILIYYWRQISGPTISVIANANASIANATSLTIGQYVFGLMVTDENNNNASSRLYVTVIQERNTPPIANAGGDQSVTLPISVIIINGSKSTDDLRIVNFNWSRESGSLAVGAIVGNSDHQPILMLTNVVAGRYVFRLTVTDDQGLTNSDTVSIIVHPDPLMLNLVELTLTMEARVLTESELESLEQKLILLLGDNIKFHVRGVKVEQKTKEAVVIFYVEKINSEGKYELMSGQEVESVLKEKFWRDAGILLGTSISDIRTTICQNTCSGHGVCNSETRACLCETFWMPDIFYFWGVSEANCDWSILYVIIGVFIGFLFLSGICWGITCLCRKSYKPRTRSKPQKYALLGTHEEEMPTCKSFSRGTTLSDSETDSDVLFESRSKSNGILRSNGDARNGGHKYSVSRLGRRIKT